MTTDNCILILELAHTQYNLFFCLFRFIIVDILAYNIIFYIPIYMHCIFCSVWDEYKVVAYLEIRLYFSRFVRKKSQRDVC